MEYFNIAVIVIAVISLYLDKLVTANTSFDTVVRFFLFFIGFHNLYTLVYEVFELPVYIDAGFPFGLVYGPLFYMAFKTSSDPLYSKKQAALHFIPFFIALFFFIYFCVISLFDLPERRYYYDPLYLSTAFSMVGYVLYSLVFTRKRIQSEMFLKAVRLTTIGVTLLVSLSLLFMVLTLTWEWPKDRNRFVFSRFFIYSTMLVQVVAVLHYQIMRLMKYSRQDATYQDVPVVEQTEQAQYQKSLLSEESMNNYERKLHILIEQKVYQDPDLSLELLSKNLGAPKHHITQVLNVRIQKSFNQFINEHRVEYAQELLRENSQEHSMENLAFICGFNSKVSFNRNFKNMTGLTPSQFKSQANEPA